MAEENEGQGADIDPEEETGIAPEIPTLPEAANPAPDRSPESNWACPCGKVGRYNSIVSHRKGAKKRPECSGKIFPLNTPRGVAAAIASLANPVAELGGGDDGGDAEPKQEPLPRAAGWEANDEFPEDPEELAAYLMRERSSNGHGRVDNSDLLAQDFPRTVAPEGEFEREPAAPVIPAQYREVVALPAVARIYYDYFRAQGFKGDMSQWIMGVLQDYWANVLGKALVVVNREEITITNG